jgi:hypothetical protein
MAYQQNIENLLLIHFIKSSQVFEDSDDEANDSEEQLEAEEDEEIVFLSLCSLLDSRYLESRIYNVAKSQAWWHLIVPKYDDIRFKRIMRMDSQSFQNFLIKIQSHPIFQPTSNNQQAPVELQLAVFLRRVGSKDEIFGICSRYGISEGTVYLYCKRVMTAILSLKSELVKWPTGELRRMVHLGFNNIGGFNNVIGAIDGTHIILGTAPLKQPEIYWNRKKKYSIQCQGIVDHRGVFIDYEIGWPGSVHDAKVYRNSFFYQNVSTLIKGWDYLLGDSAYPLSTFLIKPFNNSENNLEAQFNVSHSLHRVVVENAFGRFKNRFSSLKELNVRKISTAVHFTECCIILYNFLETNNDSWDELDDNDDDINDSDNDSDNDSEDDEENNNIYNLNENSLRRAGELKRNLIITQLFQ